MSGVKLALCAAIAAVAVMFVACSEAPPADAATVITATPEDETSATPAWKTILASEAREMMDSLENYVLLDVRTPAEYEEKRIEGALLIPDYELADRAGTELPDKDVVILVYCRSGRRSSLSAETLAGMGYTAVYDFGGIIDWSYNTVSG